MTGDRTTVDVYYGLNRVHDQPIRLPQAATRLDPAAPLAAGELRIALDALHLDAASWRDLRLAAGNDPSRIAADIRSIVSKRGKMHNPRTGSGGVLSGRVVERGKPPRHGVERGARIITLTSLTSIPLHLNSITPGSLQSPHLPVEGHAVISPCAPLHVLNEHESLEDLVAVLDVAGAPALAARLLSPRSRVLVIGAGGKAGSLITAQAVATVSDPSVQVIANCWPPATSGVPGSLGAHIIEVDATDAISLASSVRASFPDGADLVFVCADVAGCEGAASMCVAEGGTIVYFSMATSFTSAALLPESLGRDCTILVGNGYVPGHAQLAIDLLGIQPTLRPLFTTRLDP